jgi:hypothetical protein
LYYSCTNRDKRDGAFFVCSSYRTNTAVCSAHYIRERTVAELVLDAMQRLLWYVQVFEKPFAQAQMERFGLQEKKAMRANNGNWTAPSNV